MGEVEFLEFIGWKFSDGDDDAKKGRGMRRGAVLATTTGESSFAPAMFAAGADANRNDDEAGVVSDNDDDGSSVSDEDDDNDNNDENAPTPPPLPPPFVPSLSDWKLVPPLGNSQTPNPEPQTPNLKPQTSNPKPQTLESKSRTPKPKTSSTQ